MHLRTKKSLFKKSFILRHEISKPRIALSLSVVVRHHMSNLAVADQHDHLLGTRDRRIEKIAREQYLMKKDNEEIILLER